MTRLRPCHRCGKREGCSIRAGVQAAVAASPTRLSLVNFRCDIKLADLQPGAVAMARLPELEWYDGAPDDAPGYHMHDLHFLVEARVVVMEAVTAGKKRGRLRCYAPKHGRGAAVRLPVLHLYPDQLTPTGEVVELCVHCCRPMDAEPPADDGRFFAPCAEQGHEASVEYSEQAAALRQRMNQERSKG